MVFIIIFWASIFFILYSYLLYPVLLWFLARNKRGNTIVYDSNDDLPAISVILTVYNEEKVIEQRVRNIFETSYPISKMEVLVGSDGSDDNTNSILEKLKQEFPALFIFKFNQRQGKTATINHLLPFTKNEILVFTDAKVSFIREAIFEVVKHFKKKNIGCVGGNIVSTQQEKTGITFQEKSFMNNEMKMKFQEGIIWGTTMGVYGTFYGVRKELLVQIPDDFSVEDFFNTMQVLIGKRKVILDAKAVCFQNVTKKIKDEFARKERIAVGNFQNLVHFRREIFKCNSIGFCFLSHKVIRWFIPLFLILAFMSNIFILKYSGLYVISLVVQLILLGIPIIDFFLRLIRLDIVILRFVTHFYAMNLALLIGLAKYLKGVRTNVWEPTRR
jgi:cellulose synthase/poly-beta-1,6-N-acetylglucosamine synthase-like glycosyltransferase